MGCLKLEHEQYKGQVIVMGNKPEKKQKKNANEDKSKKGKKSLGTILKFVTLLSILGAAMAYIINMRFSIDHLTEKLNTQTDTVNKMYEHIYEDENSIDKQLVKLDSNMQYTNKQLEKISEALDIKVIAVTDDTTISAIDNVLSQNSGSYTLPVFLSEKPIGTDTYGVLYYAEDLINETTLLTYNENGKEVYFLGQYNEDYNWDGYCVTNSYNSDGTLYGICESNFDNGERLDYKSLYLSSDNVWTYSNRTCKENANTGINIEYIFDYEKVKNFSNTNVRKTDVLYADTFVNNIEDKKMKQYYCGETTDGRYYDDSGKAYLVVYNLDETVKTLYVGKFSNGYCEDSTGEAWSISYSDESENYYYNTGKFKKNKALKKSTEPITLDEIEKIVSAYNFSCELKWKEK